ncbi:MAG TPA: universal stress protein [Bacillota bacterium]
MKVLVAVDGSQEALAAVDRARELWAANPDVEFVIVYVRRPAVLAYPPGASGMGAAAYDPVLLQELEVASLQEAQRVLEHAQRRLDVEPARVERVEEVGRTAERILATAGAHGADLIVMGRRGLHGLSRLLVGSVSKAVLDRSPVPVLICP